MRLATRAGALTAAVFAAALGAGLIGAHPAAAHVTVNPAEAAQGAFTKLTFRVPNESDAAATTKVEVVIPADTAIASVSVRPAPGWTATVDRGAPSTPLLAHGAEVTEVVSRITWTATAGGVRPGQFQEFEVSAGPLPDADRIVFKALQTYSDGEVVRWIEEPPADGGEAPEHPAPVLALAKGGDDGHAGGPAGAPNANAGLASGSGGGSGSGSGSGSGGGSGGGSALGIGTAALIAGLAGLTLGFAAWRRTRP